MEMGTMLAALDNNNNAGRKQKMTIMTSKKSLGFTVKKHYRVAYRKPSKKFIARKLYEKKTYGFMKEIMSEARRKAELGIKNNAATKRKCMAPSDSRPSRKELIEKQAKYSRFK